MMKRILICTLAWGFTLPLLAADDDATTISDPSKTGAEYAVQGEYLGKIEAEEGTETWGAQVIALGHNKFRIVGLRGGLPGEGWQRGDEKVETEGELKNGVATMYGDQFDGKIEKDKITVSDLSGNVVGVLTKVHRESPTLDTPPPNGALRLFDGSNTAEFQDGKMVMDKLLAANCCSKATFGDHVLHIEFRTPFKPTGRGQGRGNSGVYVQSRYEVQVLDSFGLEGRDNECGGIYSIVAPKVNMCFPPLTWQTYDIDFTAAKYEGDKKVKNARITVKHNGIVIADNVELPHATPGRHPEGPEPDGLYLQGHGNPVVYRNIWVIKK
jgi:hypothetical protein